MTLSSKEFDEILHRLSPVLIINNDGIRVYHASFLDFLSHDTQCKKYYMIPDKLNSSMAMGCLEIMESGARSHKQPLNKGDRGEMSGLNFNICNLGSSLLANSDIKDLEERKCKNISAELLHSAIFWSKYLCQSGMFCGEPREGSENAARMVKKLICTERALFWLEIMSLSNSLPVARSALTQIESNTLVSSVHFLQVKSTLRW